MDGEFMDTTSERLAIAYEKSVLLSAWERGFVESLQEQFNRRGKLSPRQLEILERIENDKLSSEAQDARQHWINGYDDEKRRIANICAGYYQKSGYFTALAIAILEDAQFIPSEKAWRKMCENKYAKKVLATHNAEAKYPIGSTVMFRSTADWAHKVTAGDKPCIVISAGGAIISAAKGAKPYKVLPYGLATPIECEERHLKTYRKSKKSIKKKDTHDDIPF